jgi:uncharacterized repeat protein (TIGR03803 family)
MNIHFVRHGMLLAGAALLPHAAHAQTATVTPLFSLSQAPGPALGGISPDGLGGLVLQAFTRSATYPYGVFLDFTPPASGNAAWTEKVVYALQGGADGVLGVGNMIADGNGGLLGATFAGGAANVGTIFDLVPPTTVGGTWTHTVVYSFATGSGDGQIPTGSMVTDGAGHYFGSTEQGGTGGDGVVFELTQPATPGGAWTEQVIANITASKTEASPPEHLSIDANGTIYVALAKGGPAKGGQLISLTPTGDGTWTQTVLHNFGAGKDGRHPSGRVVFDAAGNIYGTTLNGGAGGDGTVFELSRAGAGYTETILYNFNGASTNGNAPADNLLIGADGTLTGGVGTGGASGYGAIYTLTPGAGGYVFNLAYSFPGGKGGMTPKFSFVPDAESGAFYSITYKGGMGNRGLGFLYTP